MESTQGNSFRQNLLAFSNETSMHGVKYVPNKNISIIRRVIWFLMVMGWLCYFFYACQLFMKQYVRRSISTKFTVEKAHSLTFPTVTICNKNVWKKDAVVMANRGLSGPVVEILSDLFIPGSELPPPEGRYNWSDPRYIEATAMPPEEMAQFVKTAGHQLADAVRNFSLGGIFQRNISHYFKPVLTDAGYCYQFNSDGSFKAKAPGASHGISIILYTDIDNYFIGPGSFSEGFYIAFHESHDIPMMAELAYGVSPGTQTSIVLQKSLTKRVPPPAEGDTATCFDTSTRDNPLEYFQNYTYSTCMLECKTKYVIRKCGCRDVLQPAIWESKVCSMYTMLYCSTPALVSFAADPEGLDLCLCNETCFETEYSAAVSSYKYPSKAFVIHAGITSQTVIDQIRRNFLQVDIYFGKMSFQKLEESLAYTEVDMIANIGGTLGCCIGASVLTIYEHIEFAVLMLISVIKRSLGNRNRTLVTPVKIHEERNKKKGPNDNFSSWLNENEK